MMNLSLLSIRQCITNGFYRATLTYFGNDEYSLAAYNAADDEFISIVDQTVNEGFYEEDNNRLIDDNTWHTQNIYFTENTPPGTYYVWVELAERIGKVADSWTLTTYRNDEKLDTMTGFDDSEDLIFLAFECNTNEDCDEEDEEICVDNFCILSGTPRFTLRWEGEDDIDISVRTPLGGNINNENDYDDETEGRLYEMTSYKAKPLDYVSFGNAPNGVYVINVEYDYSEDPINRNSWILTIDVDDTEVKRWSSTRASRFVWQYGPTETPTEAPVRVTLSLAPTEALAAASTTLPVFCLSGVSTVVTKDRGVVFMKDLKLGDKILTEQHGVDVVYSFGHHKKDTSPQEVEYLQVMPSGLEITPDHMIFVIG